MCVFLRSVHRQHLYFVNRLSFVKAFHNRYVARILRRTLRNFLFERLCFIQAGQQFSGQQIPRALYPQVLQRIKEPFHILEPSPFAKTRSRGKKLQNFYQLQLNDGFLPLLYILYNKGSAHMIDCEDFSASALKYSYFTCPAE